MEDSLDNILQLPQRKLVVAQTDIFLERKIKNEIFVLMVEESKGSAGGRAAGSGHRRVERIYGFLCENGSCLKFFETDEQDKVDQFDIPYSAVAMDIQLTGGKPYVVQGVVDPDLVESYHSIIRNVEKA